LYQLVIVNIVLALFNLLPAFPMDGGRVLRALLALRMQSYARATAIAARVGRALALVLGMVGLYVWNPFWVLIALFVWMGAGSEARAARSLEPVRHPEGA
jgi:Zn-dependent protease